MVADGAFGIGISGRRLISLLAPQTAVGAVAVTLAPGRHPAGFFALRMMRHHERAVLHLANNRRAGRDIHVAADLHRRDQLRVASDHAAIADLRAMLVVAVIVHGDDAASDVGVVADRGVAEVAEMAGLGAPTEPRLFGLDKIADAIV